MLNFAPLNKNYFIHKKLLTMEEKGTIFKPGRLVNAATLEENKKLSEKERRAINAAKPASNKYIKAARNFDGCFVVHDPAYML